MASFEDFKKTMVAPPSLWAAAKENDLATLTQLLDAGNDIQERDPRGFSPLMLAAYLGNVDAAALLIARGADVNSVDLAGNTVLMGACFRGHEAIIDKLLAAGASVTPKNNTGLDAHAFAMMGGRTELAARLQALLEK